MNNGPDAFVFDLDGVITFTARLHASAWKEMFNGFLRGWSDSSGRPYEPFTDQDYYSYVDGKPRYEGVLSFLDSRNIRLPYGAPSDLPSAATVCGLGNRKDELFQRRLRTTGVEVDSEAIRLVRELRSYGIRTGIASSSKNAIEVLDRVGIKNLFDAIVDGNVSERMGLRGKPQPDIFLLCLSWLVGSVQPQHAAMAEDAIAGVQAGQLGGFGLVLGIDRNDTGALKRHGANWVIRNFSGITAEAIRAFFRDRARAA